MSAVYVVESERLSRVYDTEGGLFARRTKKVTALNGLSLRIEKGEIFGLLGPNGAGKTTTIKILTTLLLPTSGSVTVLGVDIVKKPRLVRSRINVVFGGERALYWRLTGRENLQYFADLYRVPSRRQRELIIDLLDLTGLSQAADRRVETYSKGMRQRLSIARALVNRPEVLFLDEPTVGLDPVGAQCVRELIAHLADQGSTIVLTTHYMSEAELLCSRIGILKAGTLIAFDTPDRLKKLAVGLSVVEVLTRAITPSLLKEVSLLPGVGGLRQISLGQQLLLQLPTTDAAQTATAVGELLSGQAIEVRVRDANLEDAYIRLVEGNPRCS